MEIKPRYLGYTGSGHLASTNLQGSALRPLPGLSQASTELLPVQGRRKAADLAFSVEGGRRREKLTVGGSLPMGESTRWREKGKGAREQGEGGGGYPPTERGERRQPLPVAKDSWSLGAGLQREVGGPP